MIFLAFIFHKVIAYIALTENYCQTKITKSNLKFKLFFFGKRVLNSARNQNNHLLTNGFMGEK